MNQFNRKDFLKLTAATAGALATEPLMAHSWIDDAFKEKIKNFGIQLWSVRSDMEKDPKGVLKKLAAYGYRHIESFDGSKGIFWGMTSTEFKSYLADLNMRIVTSHCDTNKDFEKKAADAPAAGIEYLIYPWEGADKSLDDYKKLAEELNKKGEICKKNGIKFAFHNHDYSFKNINGTFAQDTLMTETDPALVEFQMDIYWVVTAGQDPEAWLKKYPNRFISSHVKDRKKGATTNDASCVLGTGSINYSKVLRTAKDLGMKYFNVEQEKWEVGGPMNCAKLNAAYMKKLKI